MINSICKLKIFDNTGQSSGGKKSKWDILRFLQSIWSGIISLDCDCDKLKLYIINKTKLVIHQEVIMTGCISNRYRPIQIVYFFLCVFWQLVSSKELVHFSRLSIPPVSNCHKTCEMSFIREAH